MNGKFWKPALALGAVLATTGWGAHLLDIESVRIIESENFAGSRSGAPL